MIPSEAVEHGQGEMASPQRGMGKGLRCVWFIKHKRRLTLDGHDELGDNGKNPGASLLQHVMNSLAGEDRVRMNGLA